MTVDVVSGTVELGSAAADRTYASSARAAAGRAAPTGSTRLEPILVQAEPDHHRSDTRAQDRQGDEVWGQAVHAAFRSWFFAALARVPVSTGASAWRRARCRVRF